MAFIKSPRSLVRVPFIPRTVPCILGLRRGLFSSSQQSAQARLAKKEGTISSIFTFLDDSLTPLLPSRFSDIKKEIWKDSLTQSWKEVLTELEAATEEIAQKGSAIIPRVTYEDVRRGLSADQIAQVKRTGVVVIKGAVPKDEALSWKTSLREYIAANKDNGLKGFPEDGSEFQVFEVYNSKSQTLARTHPAILNTQRSLLSLWHSSSDASEVDLTTPISYFDRLRIRKPGDMVFKLGPHVDGGSVERWEDPGFRACWSKILSGGSNWRDHDPFDATPRLDANQDLYNTSNQCSIFRPWQGWTSMSTSGPGEGTLQVLPMLPLSTAYIILRPFFRPRVPASSSLKFFDWNIVDTESSLFPGSGIGVTQELRNSTHPHLKLDKTMVSVPTVEPGDQVYWHCDVVHAVESRHGGPSDSSVMYIPTVPLTVQNARYLAHQRDNFNIGLPAPDFPGGEGESRFTGRGTIEDISSYEGRLAYGFEAFKDLQNESLMKKANDALQL